jgi:two-component system, cell cycle sensor histidine kinase and response regulator CckA
LTRIEKDPVLAPKHITAMASVFLLILFCVIVFVHEHQAHQRAHARIVSHAGIAANSLWNHNHAGAAQYLSLACKSDNYAAIAVMDTRGNVFQKAAGDPPGLLQRIFSGLHLMPRITLSSPVRYNDRVIGTIRADWHCDTIFFNAMLLLVLIMVFVIFQLYMGLVNEKKALETRVVQRTRELSDLNENLQKEIKKHKASKQALEKSEERYRAYFEENIAGAYISTPSGTLITCNQQYLEIFGFRDMAQALETPLTQIYINPEERGLFLETLIQERQVSGYETTFRKIDGTLMHLLENAAAVFDEKGDLDHVRGFLLDVTEKHNLEMQLLQTQKMESIGRLAGGVAHDFNNMLNVILGHADLALDKVDVSDPLFDNLKQIRKAADHSADITRQLLAFARKQAVSPTILDLNRTVEGMLKMLHRLIGEDISLVWKPAEALWNVRMDTSQVHQILANLFVNARDAIADGGSIVIETGMKTFKKEDYPEHPGMVPGEFVRFSVTDDGAGMDQHTLDNLFDPFFTTKEVGKGTGLGLSTVYGIVRQNNGFIKVSSRLEKGTTFDIFLPRHPEEIVQPAVTDNAPMPSGNGEVILVVEDEAAILEMLESMLHQLGYAVLAETSPRRALGMAREYTGRLDLLITDVIMPDMNGRELATQVTGIHPDIRLLFMSGYSTDVIARQGVRDTGGHFIQKPFTMQDIAGKVHDVLAGEPDHPA